MKIKVYKNGALVTFEKTCAQGFYTVLLRSPAGAVHDKVSCDDYKNALEYFRAFKATAKNF